MTLGAREPGTLAPECTRTIIIHGGYTFEVEVEKAELAVLRPQFAV